MIFLPAAALATHAADPAWRVVDCRHDLADPAAGARAFAAGHVPGALFAHLDADLSGAIGPATGRHPLPDATAFEARARAWGISAGTTVVAYDASGGAFAARLWWLLRYFGHARAHVLDGGLPAWVAAGGALETGAAATPPPGDFVARPGALPVARAEELLAAGPPLLLDARDPARFRGEVEPIDARAGHIPGARNAPFRALLAPDGRLLPRDALRAQLDTALAGRAPADAVAYCGSGVTASLLVAALEEAGLPGARLYPGSWSEWIRDPQRPVATGDGPRV